MADDEIRYRTVQCSLRLCILLLHMTTRNRRRACREKRMPLTRTAYGLKLMLDR